MESTPIHPILLEMIRYILRAFGPIASPYNLVVAVGRYAMKVFMRACTFVGGVEVEGV